MTSLFVSVLALLVGVFVLLVADEEEALGPPPAVELGAAVTGEDKADDAVRG
jgi:hypothetical protein